MDFHALAADSRVNQITAKKYVTVWQESLIGFLWSPFFQNLATRIKKSKKAYFFDNPIHNFYPFNVEFFPHPRFEQAFQNHFVSLLEQREGVPQEIRIKKIAVVQLLTF